MIKYNKQIKAIFFYINSYLTPPERLYLYSRITFAQVGVTLVLKFDNRPGRETTTSENEEVMPDAIHLVNSLAWQSLFTQNEANGHKSKILYSVEGQYKSMHFDDDAKYVLSTREINELIHVAIELGTVCEKLSAIENSLSSWEKRVDNRLRKLGIS